MKKIALSILCLGILSACADNTMPINAQYAPTQKIALDVATVNFVDEVGAIRAQDPYGLNPFHPQIGEAVRKWAQDNVEAVGHSGVATVTVKDANLMTEALPLSTGPDAWFSRQQASKFVAHVVVQVSARGENDYAEATAEASRWITLPEDATKTERQDAYTSLLNGLMRDLAQNLEANIKDHMQNFTTGSGAISPAAMAPALKVAPPVPTFTPVSR